MEVSTASAWQAAQAAAAAREGSTAVALQLHVIVDALAFAGRAGLETLAQAILGALALLALPHRTALAARLKAALHESVADALNDPTALECWRCLLTKDAASIGQSPKTAAEDGGASLKQDGDMSLVRLDEQVGHEEHGTVVGFTSAGTGEGLWARVLCFAASLEAMASGLPAVSRSFQQLLAQPFCWRGKDITLQEHHFRALTAQGDVGWCEAFRILPTLQQARTVRLVGFADSSLRARSLPPLRSACRAFCPGAELLTCSFCERHHGPQVDLPSPRKLTAVRRPSAEKGGGLLLGNGPLQVQDGRRGFSVRILKLGPRERVDIGVTMFSPHEHFTDTHVSHSRPSHRHISFAEDLLRSWVIESSGLLVGSHAGLRIRDSRWDARQLRTGDELGLSVASDGGLVLYVNGELRASWRARVPSEAPLYPVLDLFEGAPQLQLVPDVIPSPSPHAAFSGG